MVNSLGEIVQKLNGFASEKSAESWDNVGLLIEPATPKYVRTQFMPHICFFLLTKIRFRLP